jgi:hypothetical protein
MTDPKDTLFGHLALRFSAHPENLATEALGFVLRKSGIAREALGLALEQVGVKAPAGLHFVNQVGGEDSALPDLVGLDEAGQQLLIMEAKFWAGLTENQPVTYLARLPKNANGALVVVAPEKRVLLLWHELLDRCEKAKLEVVVRPGSFPVASIGRNHTLALVSWRALLAMIMTRLQMAGEHALASDVGQLEGLCGRMDEDAFLPLTSEEVCEGVGRRVWDYTDLVERVVERASQEKLCILKGGKLSGGRGYYGRYVLIGKYWYGIYFSAWPWKTFGRTPIWFYGSEYDPASYQPIRDALASLATMVPPRLYLHDERPFVPLLLKKGVGREEVVKYLMEQLREVVALLRLGIPDSASDPTLPPEDAPTERLVSTSPDSHEG